MLLLSIPYRLLCLSLAWAVHGWQQPHQHGTNTRHQQESGSSSWPLLLQQRSFNGRFDSRSTPGGRRGSPFHRNARIAHPWLGSSRAPDDESASEKNGGPASGAGSGGGDEECPSEEECEIDWDKMPGFAEEEGDKQVEKGPVQAHQPPRTSMASKRSDAEPSPPDRDSMPQRKRSVIDRNKGEATRTVESSRLRLEMMWKLDEAVEDCEVERPETCGSRPCGTCRGRGVAACRFCGGRRVLGFSRESARSDGGSVAAFYACTICDDHGMESCQACRGTGWVAEWALLTPGTYTTSSSSSSAGAP